MISLIMLIEYRDRGIMFMWPNARSTDRFAKKLRLNQKPINYIRKLVFFLEKNYFIIKFSTC